MMTKIHIENPQAPLGAASRTLRTEINKLLDDSNISFVHRIDDYRTYKAITGEKLPDFETSARSQLDQKMNDYNAGKINSVEFGDYAREMINAGIVTPEVITHILSLEGTNALDVAAIASDLSSASAPNPHAQSIFEMLFNSTAAQKPGKSGYESMDDARAEIMEAAGEYRFGLKDPNLLFNKFNDYANSDPNKNFSLAVALLRSNVDFKGRIELLANAIKRAPSESVRMESLIERAESASGTLRTDDEKNRVISAFIAKSNNTNCLTIVTRLAAMDFSNPESAWSNVLKCNADAPQTSYYPGAPTRPRTEDDHTFIDESVGRFAYTFARKTPNPETDFSLLLNQKYVQPDDFTRVIKDLGNVIPDPLAGGIYLKKSQWGKILDAIGSNPKFPSTASAALNELRKTLQNTSDDHFQPE